MLPTPKLVVFYNGKKEVADETILRLSDSFKDGDKGDIEVKVRMLNINYGHNQELLAASTPLKEYSWIIHHIMSYNKEIGLAEAITKVIGEMPGDFVLKPFMVRHRSEVLDMLLTEYNEVEEREIMCQDAWEDGEASGIKKAKREDAKKMLALSMDTATISAVTGLSESDINALKC